MLYNTKALKCTSTQDYEYNKKESNIITTSNKAEQVTMEDNIITCTENLIEFTAPYKNKKVTIHLEFPEQQDEVAATDFISRLKEIYLKKIEIQSMQRETPALQCITTEEKEDKPNG